MTATDEDNGMNGVVEFVLDDTEGANSFQITTRNETQPNGAVQYIGTISVKS